MFTKRLLALLVLPILLLGVAAPAAQAAAERSDFYGLYFPAGMPGTGSTCPDPYVWQAPSFCVIEPGEQTLLPGGRLRIRDMVLLELAYAWSDPQLTEPEPRKTGYDVVTANANLDATLSGPTWGTWRMHSFDDVLMFKGTFTGKFENGVPAVHFVGTGVGQYDGQHMSGNVTRTPDPYNMTGVIVETPHR